jgi:hypothetical protein
MLVWYNRPVQGTQIGNHFAERVAKLYLIAFMAILVSLFTIGYYIWREIFYLEDHCQQVAMQEVGGDAGWVSKLVDSPYWHGKKIYIGFAKQLECEHNDKPFILF